MFRVFELIATDEETGRERETHMNRIDSLWLPGSSNKISPSSVAFMFPKPPLVLLCPSSSSSANGPRISFRSFSFPRCRWWKYIYWFFYSPIHLWTFTVTFCEIATSLAQAEGLENWKIGHFPFYDFALDRIENKSIGHRGWWFLEAPSLSQRFPQSVSLSVWPRAGGFWGADGEWESDLLLMVCWI